MPGSGTGYNPYRDSDGKFASGPGGGPGQKADKPVSERRRAPTWPRGNTYEATSRNVKDHAARTRFHAHRAEFFAYKASSERDPTKKQDLLDKAKTSATHAATCARRAGRAGPGTVGALKAKEYARKATEHATGAQTSARNDVYASRAMPRADATAGRVVPGSAAPPGQSRSWSEVQEIIAAEERAARSAPPPPAVHLSGGHDKAKVDAAIKEIEKAKASPMATQVHKNFSDPRGVQDSARAGEFHRAMKAISGKDITIAELSHGFAVPDTYTLRDADGNITETGKYKMELSSVSTSGSSLAIVSFKIVDKNGDTAATMERQFKKLPGGGVSVYHANFRIVKAHQGSGLSDHVQGNAFRNYEKWGVKEAKVTAAGVGQYAWARLGMAFNNPDDAVHAAERFISRNPHLTSKKAELMAEVRLRATKSGPHGLAAMDVKGDNPNFTGTGPKMKKVAQGSMRFKDTYNERPTYGDGGEVQKHGFSFGQAVLMSPAMEMWGGTMKIDRNNDGYLHAISKTKVAK